MKQFISKYGGIIAGAVYGVAMRLLFNVAFDGDIDFTDLFSITFVWIVPVIIGVMPMLFAGKEQLSRMTYTFGTPVLSVFLFFLFCFITRLEDIICLVIIAIPFVLGAGVGGLIAAAIILKYRKRKGILYSVFLLPFLSGLIEEQVPTPSKSFEVITAVVINSTPDKIWENVVRVKQIDESEYNKGFFNYAGIPRPLFAELDKDTIGATRTGHFEGGLLFKETVTHWQRNEQVSFDITVIPSSIRSTIFDQHILKGQHFRFLNASYSLRRLNHAQTELILSSSYRLDTKINFYGSWWGNQLLTDFQERLLAVIKKRCDK
jgi:hypothetical protein